jgi:peroxiredoxin
MKQIFLLILAVIIIAGCSQKNEFIVKGQIDNAAGEKIYLYRMDLSQDLALDSFTIKRNGSFKMKLPRLHEPTFFKLTLAPNRFITLLGDSTEVIEVNGQKENFTSNYSVRNSIGSKHIQMLNGEITHLRRQVDSLVNLYNALPEDEQSQQAGSISNELTKIIDQYKTRIGTFVMENPRSFASYYALFLTLSDETMVMNIMDKRDQVYFSTIATSLNLLHPESQRVRQLYDLVLNVKAEERKARLMEIVNEAEGSGAPELSVADVNGQVIHLSSLKGKVVLLSFSASWDNASVQENQRLKPIYEKYKNQGFEIYQVSLERSKVLWENDLAQNQIPWISVSDLMYTESISARTYNVQQIPANYLLSREGEIIGKNLFGARLDDKLKEVL